MAFNIPQITYSQQPAAFFAGQLADSSPTFTKTGVAEVAIDAGKGVIIGTNTGAPPGVVLPGLVGDLAIFQGVAMYLSAKEPTGTANRYAIGDAIPIVAQGRIAVQIDTTALSTLVDNGAVYLVYAGADAGRFRQDTGAGGVTAVLVPNARVLPGGGGTAGGVGLVNFNLP